MGLANLGREGGGQIILSYPRRHTRAAAPIREDCAFAVQASTFRPQALNRRTNGLPRHTSVGAHLIL